MSNKKKKTKEQKAIEQNIKQGLNELMELKCPLWLTPTIYRDYLNNFEQHRQTFSMYASLTELFPAYSPSPESFIVSPLVTPIGIFTDIVFYSKC